MPGACWDTWEHGAHAGQLSVCPGAPAALSARAPSSVQGDTGPWGCRCARCGCTPGPGEPWVWGQLPAGGVQAGWGWVTVISCPQAAAVVSCRCRGEGAGEQAGLPGGCWAPPGARMVAALCPSPRSLLGRAGVAAAGVMLAGFWEVHCCVLMGVWESGLCTSVGCPL